MSEMANYISSAQKNKAKSTMKTSFQNNLTDISSDSFLNSGCIQAPKTSIIYANKDMKKTKFDQIQKGTVPNSTESKNENPSTVSGCDDLLEEVVEEPLENTQ